MKEIIFKLAVLYYSSYLNILSVFNPDKAAEKAITLFKKPRNKALRKKQSDYLQQHKKGSFKCNDEEIVWYNWPGAGPNLLLLHGWESSTARWKPYLKDLRERQFNVYAIDAPAHGLSGGKYFTPELYADAIAHVTSKFNIHIIIGHSVGAYATLIYCKRPGRAGSLNNLILLAPTGRIRDFMNRFFDILSLNNKIRSKYFDNFKALYKHDLKYYDSDNLVKGVGLPGLLIHDKDDKTLPYSDSVLVAENWDGVQFITTKGYGHRLKSTEVKKYIMDYLDKSI